MFIDFLYLFVIDHIDCYYFRLMTNSVGRIVVVVLLLYVPSQQLWSLRDGQFT